MISDDSSWPSPSVDLYPDGVQNRSELLFNPVIILLSDRMRPATLSLVLLVMLIVLSESVPNMKRKGTYSRISAVSIHIFNISIVRYLKQLCANTPNAQLVVKL